MGVLRITGGLVLETWLELILELPPTPLPPVKAVKSLIRFLACDRGQGCKLRGLSLRVGCLSLRKYGAGPRCYMPLAHAFISKTERGKKGSRACWGIIGPACLYRDYSDAGGRILALILALFPLPLAAFLVLESW